LDASWTWTWTRCNTNTIVDVVQMIVEARPQKFA